MRLNQPWLIGAIIISTAGCMDGGRLLSTQGGPSPSGLRGEIAPDGYDTPLYSSSAEVPPEYLLAQIRSQSASVAWSGATARAYATMDYFGNRGRQDLSLSVLHDYSTVGSAQGSGTGGSFLPRWLLLGTPLSYTVLKDCGQVANLQVHYTAAIYLLLNYQLTEIDQVTSRADASSRQPSCDPCTGNATPVRDAAYDPYSDGSAETGCAPSGSSTSGGTQYYPGDYTGGETVEWATGIGDGGLSACGLLAVVEYVCIETGDGVNAG